MKKIVFVALTILLSFNIHAQKLTIVHFNDTHSHVDPERAGDYKGRGGIIEQAAYVDSVRQADGKRNVLLLHAGDFSQGTSYFTELHGDIEIDLMNAVGYDVICLGNHEFDNGPAELARRLRSLKADVVCANYDFTGTPLEILVEPYVIVKRAGLKIGIIGLLTDISKVVSTEMLGGLVYQDPVAPVNRYAEYLKNEKKCDLVICLSHLGYVEDKELASQIRNVDVIVGGHSHTLLHKMQHVVDLDGKDVVVVQDWCWGLNAANLKVKF